MKSEHEWKSIRDLIDLYKNKMLVANPEYQRGVVWGEPRGVILCRALFRHGLNDTTNAFKAYRREVIDSVQPLVSNHFNLTVELPLKAIVRGHSYVICPISWRGRRFGASKLSLQEMGSRYMFIVLYVLLEHRLSHGDYYNGEFKGWQSHRLRPTRALPETPRLVARGR